MKYFILVLMLLITPNIVKASELWESIKKETKDFVDKSSEIISETKENVEEKLNEKEDRKLRAVNNFSANFNFSPINIPFPMAWGINGYYIANQDWMIGIDYLNSNKSISVFSFEIGELKESAYTFQAKRFIGNSFNILMGLGQRSTEVLFASNLFDLATHNYTETAAEFDAKYIRLGLGSQWQFRKQYTFSVDWISLDIPFKSDVATSASRFAKTNEAREDIENAEHILKYYPGGSVVKMNFGVIF